MREYSTNEARYHAVRTRDSTADALFFYAVLTTGVYCYPSCPSKVSLRENTRFFNTRAAAIDEGFRACKRCLSDQEPLQQRQVKLVEQACNIINASSGSVRIDDVAQAVVVSRYYLHKLFKQYLGISPKAYANSVRSTEVENSLTSTASVTQAVYNTGYNQPSTFYAAGVKRLGMSPKKYQRGGKGLSIQYGFAKTKFGKIIAATTSKGICCILFGESQQAMEQDLQSRFSEATISRNDAALEELLAAVVSGIDNPENSFAFSLDIQGTVFQEKVWNALQTIQAGETASYLDIAKQINKPKASRAVAAACAANPIAVVVPCHRVVRSTGEISGYRWGVARKQELLAHEEKESKPKL